MKRSETVSVITDIIAKTGAKPFIVTTKDNWRNEYDLVYRILGKDCFFYLTVYTEQDTQEASFECNQSGHKSTRVRRILKNIKRWKEEKAARITRDNTEAAEHASNVKRVRKDGFFVTKKEEQSADFTCVEIKTSTSSDILLSYDDGEYTLNLDNVSVTAAQAKKILAILNK